MIGITWKHYAMFATKNAINSATEPRAKSRQDWQQSRQQRNSLRVGAKNNDGGIFFYRARVRPRPTSRPFFHARSEKTEIGFTERPFLSETLLRKKFNI